MRQECTAYAQRHYFYPTLEAHLAREPRIQDQEAWIATYAPMIHASRRQRQLNRRLGYTQIDDYFPPIQQTLEQDGNLS
jgi:hypothetical protein